MQTQTITPETTLAELAVTRAGASRVFHRHSLDFCCGGQTTLGNACEAKGLDAKALISEIEQEARANETPAERWDQQPLNPLIDHLLQNFHEAHRAEVPRLLEMARKVESVHGEKSTCPKGLADHLAMMAVALEEHMQKEEQVLFPLIRAGRGSMAAMPVQVMEMEHQDHGKNLARLRELAHDFTPPPEACGTWQALYLGLAELEHDLMEHISLENNVLFPRALRG